MKQEILRKIVDLKIYKIDKRSANPASKIDPPD